eukprot:TRINITY_DN7417_c0_g1_i1.p1 TRINITY_DN7417_c0_g1~~TRINITY_DN7417_c0_g1_i1.p1  ORF type:complete len:534 (-),score=87.53 TRINITY_DN7417_c0_g1_i1:88-1575(-)
MWPVTVEPVAGWGAPLAAPRATATPQQQGAVIRSLSPQPQRPVNLGGSLSLAPPVDMAATALHGQVFAHQPGRSATARATTGRAVSPVARPVQRMASYQQGHQSSATSLHSFLPHGHGLHSGFGTGGSATAAVGGSHAPVAFAQVLHPSSAVGVTAGTAPGGGSAAWAPAVRERQPSGAEEEASPIAQHISAVALPQAPATTVASAPKPTPTSATSTAQPPRFGDQEDLRNEIESLRRTLRVQEERITRLRQDVVSAQESEAKRRAEAEVARAEVTRLVEELRLERAAREQAEALAFEQQAAAEAAALAAQQGSKVSPPRSPKGSAQRSSSGNRRNASAAASGIRNDRSGTTDSGWATPVQQGGPHGQGRAAEYGGLGNGHAKEGISSAGGAPRRTAMNSGQRSARPQQVKDDIDEKLMDYAARTNSRIQFRRLNRGWYQFRAEDGEDRHVELSVVNGKLMARVEPSTYDPGWNNGKLGSVERFLAFYASIASGA